MSVTCLSLLFCSLPLCPGLQERLDVDRGRLEDGFHLLAPVPRFRITRDLDRRHSPLGSRRGGPSQERPGIQAIRTKPAWPRSRTTRHAPSRLASFQSSPNLEGHRRRLADVARLALYGSPRAED